MIERYVNEIIKIAKDNRHGYSQKRRNGNPDFDCSSLVIYCVDNARIPVKRFGASYTGNMYRAFLKAGFKDVTKAVNFATGAGLKDGDILLTPYKHTEIYIGGLKLCGARRDIDGKQGDSTGGEIEIHPYKNYPWRYCLRYAEPDTDTDWIEPPESLISDIIKGKYGNGMKRKAAITKMGYNYALIQSIVNSRIKGE